MVLITLLIYVVVVCLSAQIFGNQDDNKLFAGIILISTVLFLCCSVGFIRMTKGMPFFIHLKTIKPFSISKYIIIVVVSVLFLPKYSYNLLLNYLI